MTKIQLLSVLFIAVLSINHLQAKSVLSSEEIQTLDQNDNTNNLALHYNNQNFANQPAMYAPMEFLTEYEGANYHKSILSTYEKLRFHLDDDFKRLDSSTKTENSMMNKLLGSILDKFISSLQENIVELKERFPTVKSGKHLNEIKLLLQAETKNFDEQFFTELATQTRSIQTLLSFYMTDMNMLFKLQSAFLEPTLIEGKLNAQFDELARNLLSEEIKTANALNTIVSRKMDFIINSFANFRVYYSNSLNFLINDHRQFTAYEILYNEHFNDLTNKLQKLKVVTILNVNNFFSKSYDRNQRIINLELIKLKETLFGPTGSSFFRAAHSYSSFLSNIFTKDTFDTALVQFGGQNANQLNNFNKDRLNSVVHHPNPALYQQQNRPIPVIANQVNPAVFPVPVAPVETETPSEQNVQPESENEDQQEEDQTDLPFEKERMLNANSNLINNPAEAVEAVESASLTSDNIMQQIEDARQKQVEEATHDNIKKEEETLDLDLINVKKTEQTVTENEESAVEDHEELPFEKERLLNAQNLLNSKFDAPIINTDNDRVFIDSDLHVDEPIEEVFDHETNKLASKLSAKHETSLDHHSKESATKGNVDYKLVMGDDAVTEDKMHISHLPSHQKPIEETRENLRHEDYLLSMDDMAPADNADVDEEHIVKKLSFSKLEDHEDVQEEETDRAVEVEREDRKSVV